VARLKAAGETALMERDIAELNNAVLQRQIGPHFLFNTLNFVYSAVHSYSEAAGNCILELSDVMRYVLDNCSPGKSTSLDAEISQVNSVISLNSKRFGRPLQLAFTVSGTPEGFTIVPLLLLTLTENVLKHAVLDDPRQPAHIDLSVDQQGLLTFTTANAKKRRGHAGSGTGTRNTIKRLDYSYPGRYTLYISDVPDSYRLILQIRL
jgi:two-component system, LytTR family, sensor kinase